MDKFSQYQKLTDSTAIYDRNKAIEYLGLGISSEAGEVSGVIKKLIRDDYPIDVARAKMVGELGDVLWYVSQLCNTFELELSEVALRNIKKLTDRQAFRKIKGDGDDR